MPASMATWQVLRQVAHMAANATVPSGNAIFGSATDPAVHVGKVDAETIERSILPMFVCRAEGYDHPVRNVHALHRTTVACLIVVDEGFDPYGSAGQVGVARADTSESPGAGAVVIRDWLERDGGAFRESGVQDGLGLSAYMLPGGTLVDFSVGQGEPRHLFGYECRLIVAHVNDEASYDGPVAFSAADAGSGNATLTITMPPNRFDNGGVYIRSLAGATPPATTVDGSLVTTLARGGSPYTHAAGAGQISYRVWGAYDPDTQAVPGTNPGTSASTSYSSDSLTATVTVT